MNALWMKTIPRPSNRETFVLQAKELWHKQYKDNTADIDELINEAAEIMMKKHSPNMYNA